LKGLSAEIEIISKNTHTRIGVFIYISSVCVVVIVYERPSEIFGSSYFIGCCSYLKKKKNIFLFTRLTTQLKSTEVSLLVSPLEKTMKLQLTTDV
jgi:hypothetical protein